MSGCGRLERPNLNDGVHGDRKKMRRGVDACKDGLSQDPVVSLPWDVLWHVLSYSCAPQELAAGTLVSKRWRQAVDGTIGPDAATCTSAVFAAGEGFTSASELGIDVGSEHVMRHCAWDLACDLVWRDKTFIPKESQRLRKLGRYKEALKFSLEDARRTSITVEEFLSLKFEFRFKKAIGVLWCKTDPYWMGKPARKWRFSEDHTMAADDVPWSFRWRAWPNCAASNPLKAYKATLNGQEPTHAFMSGLDRSGEGGAGKGGTVDGEDLHPQQFRVLQVHDFPPEVVFRTERWGFILQSVWAVFSSEPFPLLQGDGLAADRMLDQRLLGWQWDAARMYNHQQEQHDIDIDEQENEEEEEEEATEAEEAALVEDAAAGDQLTDATT